LKINCLILKIFWCYFKKKSYLDLHSKMNTLLLTVIFLVNLLIVSNDSNVDYEFLLDNSKKFNTISYDRIVHDSQSKLLQVLKMISKNQNRMVLSVDQLIHLIDHEIITYKQSELIWTYLASKSEKPEESPKEIIQSIPFGKEKENEITINMKNDSISSSPVNKTSNQQEEKKSFSFYQLMFLLLIGYTIGAFFIIVIVVALYQRETFILLCFLSVFLSYNFLNYARILKDQMNADFVPALLFNSSFCLTNLIIHLILMKLKLHKKYLKWTDIFSTDEAFTGKFIQSVLNIFMSYNLAFSCKTGLIQIPFFLSLYYMVYLTSCKLERYSKRQLGPSWLLILTLVAFANLYYIYKCGSKSFIFLPLNRMPENLPDFQFIGYFFSVFVLNTLFPVYLYIQHKQLWKIYGSPEFSYKLVFKTFREEISQDVLVFDFNMFYYHIYVCVIVVIIYIGLRIKMFLMVVIPSFALQSYMGFVVKDERFFWMIFFYLGSLYVLHSVYLLGKMEDKFAISVFCC